MEPNTCLLGAMIYGVKSLWVWTLQRGLLSRKLKHHLRKGTATVEINGKQATAGFVGLEKNGVGCSVSMDLIWKKNSLWLCLPSWVFPVKAAGSTENPANCSSLALTKHHTSCRQNKTGGYLWRFKNTLRTPGVLHRWMQVASLKAGDYFGENALLRNEPRNATIKATGQAPRCETARFFGRRNIFSTPSNYLCRCFRL